MTEVSVNPQFIIVNPPIPAQGDGESSGAPSSMWPTMLPTESPQNEPPNEPYQPDPTNCVRIRTNQVGNPNSAEEPDAAGRWWVIPGTGAACKHERYVYSRPQDINNSQQYIIGSSDANKPWTINTLLKIADGPGVSPTGDQPSAAYKTSSGSGGRIYTSVDCDTKRIIAPGVDELPDIIMFNPLGRSSLYPGTEDEPDFSIWKMAVVPDLGVQTPAFYSLITGAKTGATARFVQWGSGNVIRVTEIRLGPYGEPFRPGEELSFEGSTYTRSLDSNLAASKVVPAP